MKKNNLFKAVGAVILAYVLLSWIIPIVYSVAGLDGDVSHQVGLTSIFSVILETFSGFGTVVLFILLVGAFYGVLKATGAYDKIVEFLANKAKSREKATLIIIMVAIAVISSIAGLDLGFLIVFPILIGLVVKIGYDKLVALSATVGATLIGMYGSTFAGTMYGINNTSLGLETYDKIVFKLLFFVLGLVALIAFVLMYCKKNKFVFNNKNVKKVAVKKDVDTKTAKIAKTDKKVSVKKNKVEKKDKSNKKERTALPGLIVFGLLCLLIFLGTTSWEGIFGSNLFSKAHEAWTGFTIGGFDILNKLFGGVEAFGTSAWTNPLRFQTYSMLLVIAMIAISIIYRTSIKDSFEGFVDGIKSFVVPGIVAILACSVFVFVYYYPVLTPVTNLLLKATDEFNVALSGIYTIINSLFYVDYYYFASTVLYTITSIYEDSAVLSIISVMLTNLYSLVMFIAPTSVLLLVSLSISDVEYTTWVKYIWKLVLTLLIISFVIFSIMVLI